MAARAPDPDSLRYATYWEPVLAGPGRHLLDRLDSAPDVYLDVGAGTGGLVVAAAERWPTARIICLDGSVGMLSVGQHRVASERPDDAGRLEWVPGDAADIPLDDASVDVATTCFMLQLVDDRLAVLREMRRVLRPGGVVGLVTWIAGDILVAADEAYEEVVMDLGLEEESDAFRPGRTTDYESLDEARQELVAAGFADVDVRADELRHAWTREGYLVFKEHYDDLDLFEGLDAGARERLREALRERWSTLPESAFEARGPLVSAIARRPKG